ncbi:MAG: undecaprenyldiphospho-muramoylpentapeptide beta-N-acetylglucosaminyltransferase [Candidatus Dormibacteraeota bacterium]|nr:undecaprenyldiphospho-muramoylpentapeptide beta-N-acetylglucosaminyltransferase [Candidatus Dormibacteraeota bacterium]
MIAGGGTGGHLTPVLATAQALRAADPDGDVTVVGRAGGVAERLVAEAGFPLETLRVSGVDAGVPSTIVKALAQLPSSTMAAYALLRSLDPDVVVGGAGYVCLPVIAAARARRLPAVLLEQNALPGRTTRLLARRARVVATSFEETASHLHGARTILTGNPIRREVQQLVGTPLGQRCTRILVTGGSQGAHRINVAVAGCVRTLLEHDPAVIVTHQCGSRDIDEMREAEAALPAELRRRYRVAAFFDDLGRRMADSDLVVMRAGGSSLAECSALGRPMILVPYPHVRGHQRHNAAPYEQAGAATVIEDEECTPAALQWTILGVLRDPDLWRRMAEASRCMGRPDAAERVARLIVRVGDERR